MDVMMIVYIAIAAALGAAVAFLIAKRGKDEVSEEIQNQLTKTENENQELSDHILSLKKELEKQEDELEELEDDLKNKDKRLKQQRAEAFSLQEEKDKIEKECKQLANEIEKQQEELKRKKEELQLSLDSLDFVQKILSAPEVSDQSFKDLYKKIESIRDFIEDEVQSAFDDVGERNNDTQKMFTESLRHWEESSRKTWLHKKTAIAFVGEFSAGKTSIVNSILQQGSKDSILLPVSTKATTAIPTYISDGANERYTFFSPDNKLKELSEQDFKKVNKEVLNKIGGVSSLIQYFVMTYKNPNLKNLSILDTPGFSSNDKEDTERTIGVINECDALFWVFDVNAGTVNRSSIDLIKNNLHKPLYVVINKVNTKPKTEVDKVEQLIRTTLQQAGIEVRQFIRFSQEEKLDVIMNPIKSVKRTGIAEEYLNSVNELLKSISSKLTKQMSAIKRDYDQLDIKADEQDDIFVQNLIELQEECEEIASIPRWETHLFNSDKFEMSKDEYNKMKDHLQTIKKEKIDTMKSTYEEQKVLRQDIANKWKEYIESREDSIQFQKLIDKMNKKIKEFNKYGN